MSYASFLFDKKYKDHFVLYCLYVNYKLSVVLLRSSLFMFLAVLLLVGIFLHTLSDSIIDYLGWTTHSYNELLKWFWCILLAIVILQPLLLKFWDYDRRRQTSLLTAVTQCLACLATIVIGWLIMLHSLPNSIMAIVGLSDDSIEKLRDMTRGTLVSTFLIVVDIETRTPDIFKLYEFWRVQAKILTGVTLIMYILPNSMIDHLELKMEHYYAIRRYAWMALLVVVAVFCGGKTHEHRQYREIIQNAEDQFAEIEQEQENDTAEAA